MIRGTVYTTADAFAVELPEETKTYKPISNKEIVHKIVGYCIDRGFEIEEITVDLTSNYQVMFGNITLKTPEKDYGMNIGFVNSYDKSKRFGIAVGAKVFMCSNLDFSETSFRHKHTGEIQEDIDGVIFDAVDAVEIEYERMLREYEKMKETIIDRAQMGEILGRLYFDIGCLRSTQLSEVKRVMEDENDWNNHDIESVYGLHMGITHALKSEQPATSIIKLQEARRTILEYVNTGDFNEDHLDVNPNKVLDIDIEPRYWDDSTINGEQDLDMNMPGIVDGRIIWRIDVETGQIMNWRKGDIADIYYKVCDAGEYTLSEKFDSQYVSIHEFEGYVPCCLSIVSEGYGDYVIMQIDKDGFIRNWKFNEEKFKEEGI